MSRWIASLAAGVIGIGAVVGYQPAYALATQVVNDRDCSDFATQADAQTYFDAKGYSATNDPERLDDARGVGNGLACEALIVKVKPTNVRPPTTAAPTSSVNPPATSAPTTEVDPRTPVASTTEATATATATADETEPPAAGDPCEDNGRQGVLVLDPSAPESDATLCDTEDRDDRFNDK